MSNRMKVKFENGNSTVFHIDVLEDKRTFKKLLKKLERRNGAVTATIHYYDSDWLIHPTCDKCYQEGHIVDCNEEYSMLCEECAIEEGGEEALQHIIKLRIEKRSTPGIDIPMPTQYYSSGIQPIGTVVYRDDFTGYYEIVTRSNQRQGKQLVKCVLLVNGLPTVPMFRIEYRTVKGPTNEARYTGYEAYDLYKSIA